MRLTAQVDFRVEGGAVARLVIDRVAKRNALTRAMWEFPKPTIAVVRGHCIGGGLEIAVNC